MTLRGKKRRYKRRGRQYCIEFFLGHWELRYTRTVEGKRWQRGPLSIRKNSKENKLVHFCVYCLSILRVSMF